RVGGDARAHARQDPCSGLGWVAQRPGPPWCPGRLRRRRRGCCVDRGRRVPATADGVVRPGPGGPRGGGGGAGVVRGGVGRAGITSTVYHRLGQPASVTSTVNLATRVPMHRQVPVSVGSAP